MKNGFCDPRWPTLNTKGSWKKHISLKLLDGEVLSNRKKKNLTQSNIMKNKEK